jgi:hypothetical protein
MPLTTPLTTPQRVVQICLYLVAAVALVGGATQMMAGSSRLNR